MMKIVRPDVLIVDDDARNRKLLEALLAADGHATRACESGAAALQAIAERRPQAVLIDVMMPGMDGFELIRRLKADAAARTLPVIVITALDDDASRARLAAAGIIHVLTKPIDRWQLRATLNALLAAERSAGEGGNHES